MAEAAAENWQQPLEPDGDEEEEAEAEAAADEQPAQAGGEQQQAEVDAEQQARLRRLEERQRRLTKRVVACHSGRGQVANAGFKNPSWVEGRLFVYEDGSFGFLFTDDVGFLIDYYPFQL